MNRRMFLMSMVMLLFITYGCGVAGTAGTSAAPRPSPKLVTPYASVSKDDYLDITPDAVLQEIGCRVYKSPKNLDAFIDFKDKQYPIGIYFGGWGIEDIQTCDFDQDGQKDLIFTYSWGSGIHRSMIGIFNLSTMEETALDYVNMDGETMLEKDSDTHFIVYDAAMASDDGSGLYIKLTKGKRLTDITCESGQPDVKEPKHFSQSK